LKILNCYNESINSLYKITFYFVILAISINTTPIAQAKTLLAGKLVKSPEFSAVYYITDDGHRNVFPNEEVFFSWYNSFDSVLTISSEDLATFPIGDRVTMQKCTKLIKQPISDDVFIVGENSLLHKITSETQAYNFFGENWTSNIVDISDVFWIDYAIGDQLNNENIINYCPNIHPTNTLNNEQIVYDNTTWPTDSHVLSDAFGPRDKDGIYDFHRGIDIPGNRGDSIYSIADGNVYRIFYEGDPENPFINGGTTIILKHEMDIPIEFHGNTYSTYYSYYLHLEDVLLPKDADINKPQIKKGDLIGTMGNSGTTDLLHLHFETRIATPCSREFQLEHSDLICSNTLNEIGIDPHVNPLLFLKYENENSLSAEIFENEKNKLYIYTSKDELDFNSAIIETTSGTFEIDLNLRKSIDPNNRDNNEYLGLRILPKIFNTRSNQYKIIIETLDNSIIISAKIADIWGNIVEI